MNRYIAIAWNHADAHQCDTAREIMERMETRLPFMSRVFTAAQFVVFHCADRHGVSEVRRVGGDSGVVLGKLFRYGAEDLSMAAPAQIDEAVASDVLRSRGRSLLRRYWGRYTAFLHDPRDQRVIVLPDPAGESPCYVTTVRGVTLLFSCTEDCLALDLVQFSINWTYVAAATVWPAVHVHETGLREVRRLCPGESLEIRAGAQTGHELRWNLAEIALTDPIEDMATAASAARATLQACTNAWASCYPRIVHCLSGGLDSTVVLAGLMRAPCAPELTCVNLFDRSVGGDERAFARLAVRGISAATQRHCPLIELERLPADVRIETLLQLERSPLPSAYMALCSRRHLDAQVSRERDAVLFTGLGGDYIFYRGSDCVPAVDYFSRHGFGRDLMRVMVDSTIGNDGTFWGVLWQTLRSRVVGDAARWQPVLSRSPFLHAELTEPFKLAAGTLTPPWLRACATETLRRVPPYKLKHLAALYTPYPGLDPFGRPGELSFVTPLFSQPVFEVFARIATYVLKEDGMDRAVARRAFRAELPEELLARRGKGATNVFLQNVVRNNERFFRELLLDGALVRERILDRGKLEAFFSTARDGYAPGMTNLVGAHIDLELWLRSWENRTVRRVQAAA